ncbi:DUF5011 domain-containing protein [Candidatus Parcubacteria bacterium]|nr:DUF5011 domain-containing protein [Candidatus Parcubacteria bacterium]
MLRRFLNFVQYNNALPIALMVIFLSVSGAMAASPDARDALYSAQSAVRSVDNTYLAALNPDTRDFKLRIAAITDDADKYYIEYSFNTVDVKDYVWQEIPVTKTMTVSKKELLGGDLGIFVAKELSQLLDSQRSYLAGAKKIALKEGVTQKVVTVEYSGLVGKFLNPTEETFAGYTPTKPDTDDLAAPAAPTTMPPSLPTEGGSTVAIAPSVSLPTTPPAPDAAAVRAMIEEAVRAALAQNAASVAAAAGSTSSSGSSGGGASSSSSVTPAETPTETSSAAPTETPTETASTTPTETPTETASSTPAETEPAAAPDTTPPTITLSGNNPATIQVGSSYVDLGATVTDNVDQGLGFTMTPDSVDTSTTSVHTLTFTATDSAGNTTSVTRTVNVE